MIGVTFGDYHSYNDFNLILTSKTIGSPPIKSELVDIPGADGVLDLTEYFGHIRYKNRSLKFDFQTIVPQAQFLDLFSFVQKTLHGKRMKIVLDEDMDFYYIGRISVSQWKSNKRVGNISIDCDCEPYKYKEYETIITNNIVSSGTVVYDNLRKPVVPTIISDGSLQLVFGTYTFNISAGTYTLPEITFVEGKNSISYTGTANVTVKYREGGL